MKNALRIMIALVVAATLVGGAFAGSAAAQNTDSIAAAQDTNTINDNDFVDANVNALNPTSSTSVNLLNFSPGGSSSQAVATSYQNAGDTFTQINK